MFLRGYCVSPLFWLLNINCDFTSTFLHFTFLPLIFQNQHLVYSFLLPLTHGTHTSDMCICYPYMVLAKSECPPKRGIGVIFNLYLWRMGPWSWLSRAAHWSSRPASSCASGRPSRTLCSGPHRPAISSCRKPPATAREAERNMRERKRNMRGREKHERGRGQPVSSNRRDRGNFVFWPGICHFSNRFIRGCKK